MLQRVRKETNKVKIEQIVGLGEDMYKWRHANLAEFLLPLEHRNTLSQKSRPHFKYDITKLGPQKRFCLCVYYVASMVLHSDIVGETVIRRWHWKAEIIMCCLLSYCQPVLDVIYRQRLVAFIFTHYRTITTPGLGCEIIDCSITLFKRVNSPPPLLSCV